MNKTRIEALSDGVFSIVMTLLVIELKVPHVETQVVDGIGLWQILFNLWPIFRSYIISFFVLAMYWTAHHAFFHLYVGKADRRLSYINMLFLMFLSLIPFSAHLLGIYADNTTAIFIYAVNIIALGLTFYTMLRLIVNNPQMQHENLTKRLVTQGIIRIWLPSVFALCAVCVSRYNLSLSYFLFAFPIVFNIIPGTLDSLENFYTKILKPILTNKKS